MSGAPILLPREMVLASAGTGKTFRISSRIIGLLAAGVPAESIFASTFTRKAAGEILDRVLARIAAAALDEKEAAELAEHVRLTDAHEVDPSPEAWLRLLRRLSRELHRVNIGTIDAFFVRAASSFADDIALPPTWSIADAPAMRRLHAEALQAVLDGADGGVLVELVRGVTSAGAGRSVHAALLDRADRLLSVHHALDPEAADAWLGFDAIAAAGGVDLVAARQRLSAALRGAEVPRTTAGAPDRRWAGAMEKCAAAIEGGDWDTLIRETLFCASLDDEVFCGREIPEEVREILHEAAGAARHAIAVRLARQSRALGRLAELLAAAVERKQRASGSFDFGDLTRLLGGPDPLCRRDDLYYRLDARTQHILLDEFQDTSLSQWEALQPLVEELLSGCEGERAAIVVADPKQSIYAWRGGEPRLVTHVGEHFQLRNEGLHRSWRSSQVVLDAVNRIFTGLPDNPVFGGDDIAREEARSWSEAFVEHTAARQLPGHVRMVVGPVDEGRGTDRPQLCRRAARIVADLHRAAPDRSVGVLTRRNRSVARLMLELKELGVEASEEGGNPLTDSAAVATLLALLHLADHPGDRISRYHVARTPLGARLGFTDPEDASGARKLSHDIRARLLERGYGRTVETLVEMIRGDCDARELRRTAQLVELAFRYESRATLRPTDFLRMVEEERVEDPTTAAVRVMTVHQSKGLEFDIVVLPELDEPLCRTDADLLTYRPHPAGRITRAFPYVSEAHRALFPEMDELHAAHRQARQGRLRDGLSGLYVALTRARHAVHIVVKPDGKSGPGTAMSGARLVANALGAEGPGVEGRVLHESGNPFWYRESGSEAEDASAAAGAEPHPGIVRLRRSPPTRSFTRRSPSELAKSAGVDLKMMLNLESGAALRGTLVHAWLEHLAWIEDGLAADGELLEIARGIDPDVSAERVAELAGALRGWLAAEPIRQAMSRARYAGGAAVEREVPFIHRDHGALMEGVIDRLVVERANGVVTGVEVLDFKTDALAGSPVETLDARAAYYAPQMRAYRRAAARGFGLPEESIRCTLLFLDAGEVRTV